MASEQNDVFLAPCCRYDAIEISAIVDSIAQKTGALSTLRGASVLLKPNLISGCGIGLSCSHPEFIAGVAHWFKEQGANVRVGDSPAFGSARSVCDTRKITRMLHKLGVEIVEFSTPVETRLASGRIVTVAAEALECDYFIGLPRVKAHNQMYVTLAVKNVFGIVKGVKKAMLHMTCDNDYTQFSEIILGLIDVLPPQFHFIDGIEVMSQSGPLDGVPLSVQCVGASASPIALDTAFLDVLELKPSRSPLYVTAQKMGLYGADMNMISYPLHSPPDFYGSGFTAPDELNPIRFNPFRFSSGILKRIGLKFKS